MCTLTHLWRSQVEAASTRLSMAVGLQSWVVKWPSLKLRVRTWKWWLEDEVFFFVGGEAVAAVASKILVWNFRRTEEATTSSAISIQKKAFMKCLSSLQQANETTHHPRLNRKSNVNLSEVETKDAQTPEVPRVEIFCHLCILTDVRIAQNIPKPESSGQGNPN